jgi:hypothetical protein
LFDDPVSLLVLRAARTHPTISAALKKANRAKRRMDLTVTPPYFREKNVEVLGGLMVCREEFDSEGFSLAAREGDRGAWIGLAVWV